MKKVLNNPDMPVGRLIKIRDFLPPPETWKKFVKKSRKKGNGDLELTVKESEGFLKKRANKAKNEKDT